MMRGKTKRRIKQGLLYAVLTLFAVYVLFPVYFLFINSFKDQVAITSNPLTLPHGLRFTYILKAAQSIRYLPSIGLTALITVLSIAGIVLLASTCAWMVVRKRRTLSAVIFYLMVAAMLIPFQSVMYPLVKMLDDLYIKNVAGLIVAYFGFGMSMSVFFYHGFIKGIPQSLEEAARIDGASTPQVFFRIVFPLLKSITATVIIVNGMWIWNDYLLPFIVIGNAESKTLMLSLYYSKMLAGQYGNPYELIFPAVLISVVPLVVVFLALGKYIMGGITAGAVKG